MTLRRPRRSTGTLRPVVAVASADRRFAVGDICRDAVAVPLDFVDSPRPDRWLVDQRRQTRLDPTRQRHVEQTGLARVGRLRDNGTPRRALVDGVGLPGLSARTQRRLCHAVMFNAPG